MTTAGASAAQRGRGEAAADAAWTVGLTELKPTRNAVRLVFSVEDAARIPNLESALNRDMRMALTEGIDRAIFLGEAGANENTADIVGLNTATGLTEKTITQANKVKGPETLTAFAELVDGLHAESLGDLRVVAECRGFHPVVDNRCQRRRRKSDRCAIPAGIGARMDGARRNRDRDHE